MLRKAPFLLILPLLLWNSCKPKEVEVPAYLYLAPPTLVTKSDNSQGYPSILVPDHYVFLNGDFRGLFANGSTIPLMTGGNKAVMKIGAGIKYNGMAEQRAIYPMYNYYEKEFNLQAEHTDTIKPVFTYVENTVFPIIEDYDANSFVFTYNPQFKANGDTVVRDNSQDAWLPGKYSGKVVLGSAASDNYLEIYSPVQNNWPRFTPSYLELDYKGSVSIIIGIYATYNGETSKYPIYVANPKSDWNKLYLNLESEINSRPPGTQFRIYLGFRKENAANPYVFLDNLKVLYLD